MIDKFLFKYHFHPISSIFFFYSRITENKELFSRSSVLMSLIDNRIKGLYLSPYCSTVIVCKHICMASSKANIMIIDSVCNETLLLAKQHCSLRLVVT